jgi:filamentous hemagglutinin family protein
MNHIYRTLWSVATQSWQAVPETAKTAGKKSKSAAGGVIASVALSFSLTGGAHAQAPPAINQLPTGGSVMRGTATIQQTATAQAAAMTVNQTSQRAVVNWNTFNIGSAASVNFVQPNAQAVTLNRVNDSNPSQIFGRMTSNGQVVLTNANGIYFAPGSSVDVGAITATTHSISDDNFMSGKYVFERNGATGKIINEGNITAALAGYVALLAPEVQNAGVVVARAGTVAMAAGETITLNIDGAGSLAGITTTPSAIATLIENKQAVQAPDGQIILSAVALNKLQAGVIKNSGSLEANNLVSKGGKIYLEGDDITLSSTSKLEAKGATGGGTVLVGGDWQGSGDLRQATKVTMAAGATIDASATDKGDGGKVVLWSDVHNAESVTRANGSIKAEAGPNGGDGGRIETSGHVLNVDGIRISAQSANGKVGEWLLDPYNVYIMKDQPTSGDTLTSGTYTPSNYSSYIKSSDLNNALTNASVTVTTVGLSPGTATGNIYVYDGVAWNANKLTLNASKNIYVYFAMNGTGTASLALQYGQSAVALSNTSAYFIDAPVNLPTGANFSTKLGSDGTVKNFTVINDLGVQADAVTAPSAMSLQGMAATASLAGKYVLGSNIDATPTQGWTTLTNGYKNFIPIGNSTINFTGIFDGLGHQVNNLKITDQSATLGSGVGFFGLVNSASITNIGLTNVNISSANGFYVGSLVGGNTNADQTILNNTFTSGSVSGGQRYANIGGVAGSMTGGSATNIASSVTVTGTNAIKTNYKVGGIFGFNQNNSKVDALAYYGTLDVTNNATTGALIGNVSTTVTNGYYDSTKNPPPIAWRGSNSSSSGTNINGLTTSQLTTQSNFSALDFANVWAMGPSYPVPQFMLNNLVHVIPSSTSIVYGSNTPTATFSYVGFQNSDTPLTAFTTLPTATAPTNTNVGSQTYYASGGVSSTYSLVYEPGTVTITPKPLTLTGFSTSKVYNTFATIATTGATFLTAEPKGTGSSTDGIPYVGDTLTLTPGTATFNTKDVATATTITFSTATLGGASAGNYTLNTTYSGTITPKTLTLTSPTGLSVNTTKTYDGTTAAVVNGTLTGGTLLGSEAPGPATATDGRRYTGDTVSLNIGATPTATYSQSNVGTGLTISYNGSAFLTGLSASNYSIALTGSVAGVISKATASISAVKTYDATNSLNAAQVSITGVSVGGGAPQTLGFTGTATLSDANVSTVQKYINTASMMLADGTGAANNYVLPTSAYNASSNTASIQKLALTASDINAGTSVYGGTFVPGTVTFTNKASNTDDVNAIVTVMLPAGSLSGGGVAKVGNYYQSAGTTLTGAQADNYSFVGLASSLSANYSVTQRALLASSITSGQSVYANSITPGTAQFSNVVGSDDVSAPVTVNTVAVSTSGHFAANTYTQTASSVLTGADKDNYTFVGGYTHTTPNYTIQQRPITVVSIAGGSSTYASALAPGAVTLNDVVSNGTGTDDVSSTASVVTRNNTSSSGNLKASTYAQTAASNSLTGADAGNYSLSTYTTPTNNYTVDTLALTASGDIAATRTTYGSALVPGTLAFANKVIGDTVSAVVSVDTSTLSRSGKPIVGNYTQTASTSLTGLDAGNYSFLGTTSATANYTIDPLALTGASIATSSSTYSNALNPGAVTFSNIISNGAVADDVASTATVVTGATSTSGKPIVGSYSQNAASNSLSGADAGNYSFAGFTSAPNYTIAQKELTLSVPGASRMYDGSTVIYPTGAASIQGLIDSDRVVPSAGNVTGFVDKNVGINKAVTYTGFTFTGIDANNYVLSANPASTAEITAKPITTSGITAIDKIYNGNTTASLTVATAALTSGASSNTDNKIYSTDNVSVDASAAVGTFANANASTAKPVTITGLALSGTDAGNYIVTDASNATARITAKALTVSGTSVANKTYDGTTAASLSNGTLVGVISADLAHVSLAESGTFADKNVGTAKQVTAADSLSGSAASNYSLTQPTGLSADITKADLSISGINALNKVYDTTTTASLAGTAAVNALGNDVVNVSGTGNALFAEKNAGTSKPVSVTGFTITGTDASNYNVVQPTGLTADITKADLNISGITATNKVYDATTQASLTGTAAVSALGSDLVSVSGTGTGQFADKNAGTAKSVSVTGFSLTGADANNYNAVQPTGLTADISKAPLTVTAANAVKNLGNANPALNVSLTGFVGGETLATSGVTGTGLATTTATVSTDAGTAAITAAAGTLAASNYAFTNLVDGTLTIRPISALNNTEVSTLIGSQLASLSGAQVSSFSASQLQVFSPQQLSALSPSQLAGMTTLQLLSLSPVQMAAISPAKIASMTAAELGAFTDAQLQALSPTQLAAIAPTNFAAFTPAQIMAMSIAQVQNLSPEQLATFSPAQIASLNAAELAYFDARQLAAIGIFPKVETPVADNTKATQGVAVASTNTKDSQSKFEAPIPVMTEVATANTPAVATPEPLQVATPVQSAALSPRAVQALLFPPSAESNARTGVLAITILNSAQARPTTAGMAFEQDADTVSLRLTSAPAAVPHMSDKVVFSDKLVTFMVATSSGVMVEFEGSVVNNRMVILAPSAMAKRVARTEMNLVLAAAVTSLGKENRVILAKLDGVVLDLR